ncbi:uncharacterized protein [Garra rufa]|uniref:uncharacterized protein n=1 Tax=Garra rufa TaxID=137080 RepID=UPI003CCEE9D6
MADKCHLCLLGLIFLSSLLTGTSGVDESHVFISSGENVSLPCNNALHDCKSTTWIYNRFSYSAADELIGLGIKKNNTERHERLSLGSDCSLNIKHITKEDYGLYICRQYVHGQRQGTDAYVYLHVLHVSSSSSQTEISPGSSVSLSCQLYSYTGVSCHDSGRSEGYQLFWVNQAGVKLTISDSRYQISAPGRCIITLNTTLLNEDDNREWRCEVTHRNQIQTSATYTVRSSRFSDNSDSSPHHTIKYKDSSNFYTSFVVSIELKGGAAGLVVDDDSGFVIAIVVGASVAVLLLALILCLILKKRAGVRRATDDSVEQTDDVIYTEVTVNRKNRAKKNKVRCEDKMIYASIRGAEAGAQENCSPLYASVSKNHHKSGK